MVFQALARYFFRGLLVIVPVAVTIWVVTLVVATLDEWIPVSQLLERPVPGLGLAVTLVAIVVIGFLASNFATRWMFRTVDRTFARLPLVKLIYTSLRDLVDAFVGDRKRFDRPVRVRLGPEGSPSVPAFLTRDDLTGIGLDDHVAVYFPQSYNFAGNVLLVPRTRVEPIDLDSATVMTFIVSGGVSGTFPEPGDAS